MPRIFIPFDDLDIGLPGPNGEESVRVRGEAARRLTRVLRLQPGDHFSIIDDRETVHDLLIQTITPREVIGGRIKSRTLATDPRVKLTVLQGVPKGQKLDSVVQKCAELGVNDLVPVITERTVPRLAELRRDRRQERWQRISQQAAEQCGRASIMPVRAVISLAEALQGGRPAELRLMFYEGAVTPLREVITSTFPLESLPTSGDAPPLALILIGPEGGFTCAEVDLARAHDFTPVSLGKRLLRTETVAPVVVGILLYLFGDL